MPTVKTKHGKRKAQADSYAKMHGGKMKMNPGYGSEKKSY